jgi:hypothetical protein
MANATCGTLHEQNDGDWAGYYLIWTTKTKQIHKITFGGYKLMATFADEKILI